MSVTNFSLARLSSGESITWDPYKKNDNEHDFRPYYPIERKLIVDGRKNKECPMDTLPNTITDRVWQERSSQSASDHLRQQEKSLMTVDGSSPQVAFKKAVTGLKNQNRDNHGTHKGIQNFACDNVGATELQQAQPARRISSRSEPATRLASNLKVSTSIKRLKGGMSVSQLVNKCEMPVLPNTIADRVWQESSSPSTLKETKLRVREEKSQSPCIRRRIQNLAGNIGASELPQVQPLSEQATCKHKQNKTESCKDEDARAVNSQILNPDVYKPKGGMSISELVDHS